MLKSYYSLHLRRGKKEMCVFKEKQSKRLSIQGNKRKGGSIKEEKCTLMY